MRNSARRPGQMLATRWSGKVKLLIAVRDPADFLWAAYNTWTLASRALSFGIFFCELGLQGELERTVVYSVQPRALPGEPNGNSQAGSTNMNLGRTFIMHRNVIRGLEGYPCANPKLQTFAVCTGLGVLELIGSKYRLRGSESATGQRPQRPKSSSLRA